MKSGWGQINNTVISYVEFTENFPRNMEHALQARRAGELSRKWNDALVVIDATGGGAPAKGKGDEYIRLYRDACPNNRLVHLNWATKQTLMECLNLQIEQQKFSTPPEHTELNEQLQQFEDLFVNRAFRFGAPVGFHDDLVSALSLAVYARKEGWVSTNTQPFVSTLY